MNINLDNKVYDFKKNFKEGSAEREIAKTLLNNIPVTINNYGDPLFVNNRTGVDQWADTQKKLLELKSSGHTGPISLITKWALNKKRCEFLKQFPNVVVYVSISELEWKEWVKHSHRYNNIKLLNDYGIKNVAAVRPVLEENATPEVVEKICEQISAAGWKHMVVSGFRWDEELVEKMWLKETDQWVMRVKKMSSEAFNLFKQKADDYSLQMYTRTLCPLADLYNEERVRNPYMFSPNLVKCEELNCPSRETCSPQTVPNKWSVEFLKFLWYDIEYITGDSNVKCYVDPENRLKCDSCCTTCYKIDAPRLEVKNKKLSLWDLSFIRFITGMLAEQPGKIDLWEKDSAQVVLPNFPEIEEFHFLNSWMPIVKPAEECFGCKYCVYYGFYEDKKKKTAKTQKDIWFPPALLVDKINQLWIK